MSNNIENTIFASDEYLVQRVYWESFFSSIKSITSFPTNGDNTHTLSEKNTRSSYKVSYSISALGITKEVDYCNNTNAIFISALSILLNKYLNDDEIMIGLALGTNDLYDSGQCTSVALRIKVNEKQPLSNVYKEVCSQMMTAYQNQGFPIELLVNNRHDKLYNIAVVFNSNLEDYTISKDVDFFCGFDVDVSTDCISLSVLYNHNLYEKEYIVDVCTSIIKISADVLLNQNIPVNTYTIKKTTCLKIAAAQLKGNIYNNSPFNICQLFKETVNSHPNKIALISQSQTITFTELDELSDKVAAYILSVSIMTGDVVALLLPPSIELVASIIGVLKAGAAFLPIECNSPNNRINYILNDSNAQLVISDQPLKSSINYHGKFVQFNSDISGRRHAFLEPKLTSSIAYVIYTSGTTGMPKGVCVGHASVVNYATWFLNYADVTSEDVTALTSSLSFDLSYTLLLSVITKGVTLHVLPKEVTINTEALVKSLIEIKVTFLKVTPSIINAISTAISLLGVHFESLRLVVSGGEQMELHHLEKLRRVNPKIKIINHYGPTEGTIGCIAKYTDVNSLNLEKEISVGMPGDNITVHVLDENLNVVEESTIGELYISGACLALGYLNAVETTYSRFIKKDNEIIYRTGDLAKIYRGEVYIEGRVDNQIKIKGYRVDLKDIEWQLIQYHGVEQAVSVADCTPTNEYRIYAYIIAKPSVRIEDLKAFLKENIPEYMVPSSIYILDAIPLTANGKVDTHTLKNRVLFSSTPVTAFNDMEATIRTIWQNIIDCDINEITSPDTNFFDIGGHSLNAIAVSYKYYSSFNVKMPLNIFFEQPTINNHAIYLKSLVPESKPKNVIRKAPISDYYPTSNAQKQMFVLQEFDRSSVAYNKPYIIRFEGSFDQARIIESLRGIVKRHEAFRTVFDIVEHEIVQIVKDDIEYDIPNDVVNSNDITQIVRDFVRPFNLRKSPLFRFVLHVIGSEEAVLLIDIHHIISDGFSMMKFCDELVSLYKGNPLPNLDIQYKDYSVWQGSKHYNEELNKQKEYWLSELRGCQRMNLPYDYERDLDSQLISKTIKFSIDESLVNKIKQILDREKITWFSFLLASINMLLHKITNEKKIIIGSVVEGRTSPDLENIQGVFVNTVVYNNTVDMDMYIVDFVKAIANKVIDVMDNQDYRFEKLVQDLNIKPEYNRQPIYDFFLLYNGYVTSSSNSIDGLNITREALNNNAVKFDLQFIVGDISHTHEIAIEYNTSLFKNETIQYIKNCFVSLLDILVEHIDWKIKEIVLK